MVVLRAIFMWKVANLVSTTKRLVLRRNQRHRIGHNIIKTVRSPSLEYKASVLTDKKQQQMEKISGFT